MNNTHQLNLQFTITSQVVSCERYPIRGTFTISRGSKTEAAVVVVELSAVTRDGREIRGLGECVPYARYGETVDNVVAAIEAQALAVAAGMDRMALQSAMPAGAARNALDCAFWDLECKAAGSPAWRLARLAEPGPVATAFTLSLATPAEMGRAARHVAAMPLLKLKLGGGAEDIERVRQVRANAPDSRLIVDANEGWTIDQLSVLAPQLATLGVALIEQPLHSGRDGALAGFASPVPLGADESCHDIDGLDDLRSRYSVVNIKLDKTGGLTEALRLKAAAQAAGFQVMVGCMVATSLSMAPAFLLAQGADFVDLDGPLLLARDRQPGIAYDGALMSAPSSALWG
jgi:L-alanine-DL-glutamate epimerase-like enolase superfamily enzyme